MLGLPTETDEDVQGIAKLAQMVVDTYYENPDRPKGKAVIVSASASTFVPKPFTPFQWEPQITIDEIHRRQKVLQTSVTSRKISLSWHDANTSFLEAVFARGDRRLGAVLLRAHELGCRFDSWEEFFDLDVWRKAFADCGIDPEFYSCRARSYDEILPWDHIDFGVTKEFLIREREKSLRAETTPHCREKCSACGAADLTGGKCSVLN